MENINASSVAQLAGGLVAALLIIAYSLQNLLKNWKSNNTETSLMNIMHDELNRMAKQNSDLSKEIGNLQTQIIELSGNLTKLTVDNKNLTEEIHRLNYKIESLLKNIGNHDDSF